MNRFTKFALTGALAFIAIVGLIVASGVWGVANAQGPTPTVTPRAPGGPAGPRGGPAGPGVPHGPSTVMDAVAQVLGMTAQDLTTELRNGKTLADLAAAKGVSQDAVKQAIANAKKADVDAMVTAGRLTAEQATQIKQRIDQEVANLDLTQPGLGFGRGGHGGPGGPRGGRGGPGGPGGPGAPHGPSTVVDAVAQALGMTTQDLTTELKAGKTLADLAAAKGVSQDAVKQAIVNALKADVDAQVQAGRLTADQATQIKQRIDQEAANLDLTQPGLGFGRGGPRGIKPGDSGRPNAPGFRGFPSAPQTPSTPSGSSA